MSCAKLPWKFAAAVVAILAGAAGSAAAQERDRPARPYGESRPIEGQYIVILKKAAAVTPDGEADRARSRGGRVHHVFRRALRGYAASISAEEAERLRGHPDVELVEQDQTVSINFSQAPATWGLDRIDQADRPLDATYQYSATGQGVTAFVLDTGILANHTEFTGRLLPGKTTILDGRGTDDCHGHGTHVAGTIGGSTWGVAKQVSLVPVRVLDCRGSGSWSGVIAGIDWVASHPARPAVANMSLGGGKSSAINSAVEGAVQKGVTMVVAAGNSAANACNFSPSSAPSAITVGATTSSDARASFSNFGSCVDIFAPGHMITSAWFTGPTATTTISGTSMAAPHVAGAAALVLEGNPGASPAAVTAFLTATATPNRVASAGTGSSNLLLYTLGSGAVVAPAEPVIAVASLSGIPARLSARQWRANVTIVVRDVATTNAVAGVTVTGTFQSGGTVTCTTSSSGSCTVASTFNTRQVSSTRYTLTSLAAPGVEYDATQNSASQVTVNAP